VDASPSARPSPRRSRTATSTGAVGPVAGDAEGWGIAATIGGVTAAAAFGTVGAWLLRRRRAAATPGAPGLTLVDEPTVKPAPTDEPEPEPSPTDEP
jgi:hypothetical protein